MVTDYPTDEVADGALLMPCNDHDPRFSFTCPHSSSHGFVCTTTAEPHENEDSGKHLVYPSPPPTASQPKRNVPLPAAARQQQHYQYGGILDSPLVLVRPPTGPLSPPPTIPTPTHALPPSDAQDALCSSLLQPIPEHQSPNPSQSQLLSPISPEWTTNRKPEEDLFGTDDTGDCVLMSQPPGSAYDYRFTEHGDDDLLAGVASYGRPALRPLDIPMYHDLGTQKPMHEDPEHGILLGFPGVMSDLIEDEDAASPFDSTPSSPSSSFRDFETSDSDLDDLDLDMDLDVGPSSYGSPSLRSFASLPSPDLDDLDLDMDLGPGLGMSPSPSRRCVASLPSFDESECIRDDFFFATDPSHQDESLELLDISMSPPQSPPSALPTPHANSLLLELPAQDSKPPKTPSILDALSPAYLSSLLPAAGGYPQAELDALLDVRRRAAITLDALYSSTDGAFPSASGLTLDHELRRTVPRDSGEPRRRRKRAKELGREVDALVGLALKLLPTPTPTSAPASNTPQEVDVPTPFPAPGSGSGYFDDSVQNRAAKAKAKVRSDKAGLAGIVSAPQLVARMILRRRERCVRGLAEGKAAAGERTGSPLRACFSVEGDEPPPAMEIDA
ncbi:hypothetical protein C8R44DRAFT_189451 [Mycena epipterygia]|nr:hypothetical protein C8R44DRAFT_189451 [Mycena epipterygia]